MKGNILILGDLNSRTAEMQEMLFTSMYDNNDQSDSRQIEIRHRENCDKETNANGHDLIEIMNNSNLLALNGRTPGDVHGNFTYHGAKGSSTIDLCLTSTTLKQKILYFKVMDPVGFADHCPITVVVKINRIEQIDSSQEENEPHFKYMWDNDGDKKFRNELSSIEMKQKLDTLRRTVFTNSTDAVMQLTSLMNEAGRKAVKLKKISKTKHKRMRKKGENIMEIQKAKSIFKKAKRDFKNNEFVIDRRATFIAARKKYKKTIYQVSKFTKEQKLHKLVDIEKKDPKTFWKAIKEMINPKSNNDSKITNQQWVNHFSKLLNIDNKKYDKNFHSYVSNSLPIIEQHATKNGPLDNGFVSNEISKSINKLHRGKSAGLDLITNEMFKCADKAH
jgi:hypothetical protein